MAKKIEKDSEIEKASLAQLTRMMGLNFFPADKPAQLELAKALQAANSPEIIKAVVDEWLASNSDRPTPADLRRLVGDKNQERAQLRKKCSACNGDAAVTRWYLVTYLGASLTVKHSKHLPEVDTNEKAQEWALSLAAHLEANPHAEKQAILSAAKPCACRTAVLV